MMVLNDKCKKCNKICFAIHFQQNFGNWTSGNNYIDKFIQNSQLSVHNEYEVSDTLEWIPYDRFYDINYITEAKKYKARWVDGYIINWISKCQNWVRDNRGIFVNLKSLHDNLKDITFEFMNEVFFNFCFIKILKFLLFINILFCID
jgi:hypothetical protein